MEIIDNITVENFSFKYDGKWIFKNISFSLFKGEVIGIIGDSGSGKTTLSYSLTGIIPHYISGEREGYVKINDSDIWRIPFQDIVKKVNIVMQNYGMQIFGLTVEEDIMFTLLNLGLDIDKMEKRLDIVLKEFDLEKYRSYMISSLSGGFKQRLSIASTIALDPVFLIMDDPTANLDWRGVITLKRIILALREEGKGILFTTRRLKGFEDVVDKVIKLGNGSMKKYVGKADNYRFNVRSQDSRHESNNIIKINDLWFSYEDKYILKNINLKIRRGEIVALMGSNGSGKTTLAKHINGLLKPCKGHVEVCGLDTRKYSVAELSKHVGFVFQDPDRHITRETIWEEAVFGCRNLGLSEENAVNILKSLNLYEVRDTPPYKLNMGGKTKLAIASALAMNPDIIVLDEPTTGQDKYTLSLVQELIIRMSSLGKTIIIITHDTDFALKICNRVIILDDGCIVLNGDPEKILYRDDILKKYGIEPPTSLLRQVF